MAEVKVKNGFKSFKQLKVDKSDIEIYNLIKFDNNIYNLKKTLTCKVRRENKYYYIESDELNIIAGGMSKQEAIKDFSEDFNFVFRNYNELPESKLSD